MEIRPAEESDLPRILDITNDAILNTTSSWNITPTTLEARSRWLAERQAAPLPVLGSVRDGFVTGFGSYGAFRPWDGYALTVEHSIYVDAACRRHGAGRRLLTALLDHAARAGMHVMIGAISSRNLTRTRRH